MAGYIILGVIIVLFLIMGIVLCMGKASFLIAGYNMASKEEKGKYDEKKLCRTMGIFSIIVAVLMSGLTAATVCMEKGMMTENQLGVVVLAFAAVILIGCGILLVLCNTKCLKNNGRK